MNANDVLLALASKYSPPEYAMFTEVNTVTGASYTNNSYADAVVLGLWSGDKNIYCFEIKVSRSDFIKDVESFEKKQGYLFDNCTMFYYVAPYKLLSPEEMPEGCGLLEVQNGGRIVRTKVASRRNLKAMDLSLVRSLSRHILRDVTDNDIKLRHSVAFLGKSMGTKEVEEYVNKEVSREVCKISQDKILREARRMSREILEKEEEYAAVLREYREMLVSIGHYSGSVYPARQVLADIKKVSNLFRTLKNNESAIDAIKELMQRIPEGGLDE